MKPERNILIVLSNWLIDSFIIPAIFTIFFEDCKHFGSLVNMLEMVDTEQLLATMGMLDMVGYHTNNI